MSGPYADLSVESPTTPAQYGPCCDDVEELWDVARVDLTPEAFRVVEPVAQVVIERYEAGVTATTRFLPPGWTQRDAVFWPFLCEWALAELTGEAWNRGNHKLPDVGRDIECRATHRPEQEIVVYPSDKPYRRFVLATGDLEVVTFRGWHLGRIIRDQGVDHDWMRDGPGGRGHWLGAECLHRLPFHPILGREIRQ